jgi:hypothetical protein
MPKWIGPFQIVTVVGKGAYKLLLPDSLKRLHDVFHVSLLKPYNSNGRVQPVDPMICDDGQTEFTIERILSHRDIKKRNKLVREFLFQWMGQNTENNSWEPKNSIKISQPDVLCDFVTTMDLSPKSFKLLLSTSSHSSHLSCDSCAHQEGFLKGFSFLLSLQNALMINVDKYTECTSLRTPLLCSRNDMQCSWDHLHCLTQCSDWFYIINCLIRN